MKSNTVGINHLIIFFAFFGVLSSYSNKSSAMEACVEKIYDDKVLYKAGEFTYSQNEDGHFFTRPSQPQQEPTQQCVLTYNTMPKEFAFQTGLKYESVLRKVNAGRERVEDTKKWPFSIHAQISLDFDGDIYGGSGVLISSHHILTAAHNVYKPEMKNKWADSIEVYPGLNGKAAVFGRAKVARVYTFTEWVSNENPAYDCAIIVLDQPIGLRTGWGGLFGLEDVEEIISKKASITGYPGDKGFDQMWTMKHKLRSAEAEIFSYEIDTYDGQSGSGIWTLQGNDPYIMGVHTLGHDSMNYGVRLSPYKFNEIVNWVSKTRHIEKGAEDIPIPLVARGYEEDYLRFLKGKLIYRPNMESDDGKIELPIAALANPLEGTFDLSRCGDASKLFSISTGYRKETKPKNTGRIEMWLVPRFLAKKEINGNAQHFKALFPNKWPDIAPVGIFLNERSCDLESYDYLTNLTMEEISCPNFYNIWQKARVRPNTIFSLFTAFVCHMKKPFFISLSFCDNGIEKKVGNIQIPIPLATRGYEEIYHKFLKGKLIYRPNKGNDDGKIELPIAALANPLVGTFDLSQCGDADEYLCISTGFRTVKRSENERKTVTGPRRTMIWIVPRFLVEHELTRTAGHFDVIFDRKWPEETPIGLFWTREGWNNMRWYDYLTSENTMNLSKSNLYENWIKATPEPHLTLRNTDHPDRESLKWQNKTEYFTFVL